MSNYLSGHLKIFIFAGVSQLPKIWILGIALVLHAFLNLQPLQGQNLELVDSLEMVLELSSDKDNRIGLLNSLTNALITRKPEEALEYAEKACHLAEETGDDQGYLTALVNKGMIYWSQGDYQTAMDIAVRAEEIAEDRGSKTGLAQALHLTGLIYTDLGNYKKSSEYFFKNLAIFKEAGDQEGVSKTLNTIGVIHFEQNNYTKALDYFFNSLNLAEEINYKNGIARGLNNVAIVFQSRKEYEKAREYFIKAVEYNQELGHLKGEGINYLNLGITNQALEHYDTAIRYFNQALGIFKKLQINLLIAKTKNYIGEYYLKTGDPELCYDFAMSAMEMGRKINSKVILNSAAGLLHQLYLAKNDTASAYQWAVYQNKIKDSLNLEESNMVLSKLELLNEFNEQEKEEKIRQQRDDFITLIIIIVLFFSLTVILLIYARQMSRARAARIEKQRLEDTLEFRNKELTTNVLFLMKKNELLSKISTQLLEIEKDAVKDETKAALYRIAKEVKKSKSANVWKEFELRFNQVHDDFYKKLSRHYPELTSSDLRLCAFLKLNLTTKEISEITGQRPGTIEMARSRLRKKFGIRRKQIDIVTFLSQF